MSCGVASDIEARAEVELMHVRYNTDAAIVNCLCVKTCQHSPSLKIAKFLIILAEEITQIVRVSSFITDTTCVLYHVYNSLLDF